MFNEMQIVLGTQIWPVTFNRGAN